MIFTFDFRSEHFEEKQKRLQEYYDQRSAENTHLHQQNEQLKRQIQELQDQVLVNEAQNQQSYEQLQSEVQKLQKENKELDVALQEYRKECESLMSGRASAAQLCETEADRDKYKNQYEIALRELAQRAERIEQLRNETAALTAEVKSLQKEKTNLQSEKVELAGEVAQLKEEKSMLEQKAREKSPQGPTPFQRRIEIRLSEAVGNVRKLEMVCKHVIVITALLFHF